MSNPLALYKIQPNGWAKLGERRDRKQISKYRNVAISYGHPKIENGTLSHTLRKQSFEYYFERLNQNISASYSCLLQVTTYNSLYILK